MTMNMKKTLAAIVAVIGLVLTIVPSILVFNDVISLSYHKQLMFIGVVLWFLAAPFWMRKEERS